MTQTSLEYFNTHKFVLLENALSRQECKTLSNMLFDAYDKGIMEKDVQCPLSDSIYNASFFTEIHKIIGKQLSQHTNKKLLPTYTYARIYRNGDVLEKHIDRESCEYSVTITLDYDGKRVWPIYFEDKVNQNNTKGEMISLDIGDLILYKGQEIVHWRPKFKGEWQTQVFLHYVDAEGPNKHFENDKMTNIKNTNLVTWPKPKRKIEKTGIKINPTDPNSIFLPHVKSDVFYIPTLERNMPSYCTYSKTFRPELTFTKEECEQIINYFIEEYSNYGQIATAKQTLNVDKSIRHVQINELPNIEEYRWIYKKIADAVMVANNEHFDFEIMGIQHSLQLLKYDSTDSIAHYDWHSDSGTNESSTRKISVSVQLSDPNDYEGGLLEVNNYGDKIIGTKEQGSVHLFPSYLVHRVTPITKGIRYALVVWIHGTRRFR